MYPFKVPITVSECSTPLFSSPVASLTCSSFAARSSNSQALRLQTRTCIFIRNRFEQAAFRSAKIALKAGASDGSVTEEEKEQDESKNLPNRESPGSESSSSSSLPSALPPNVVNGGTDMMKLFNDAQQNMLYLNKQRLLAMEELARAERENSLLASQLSEREAERDALAAEKEIAERKMKEMGEEMEILQSKGGGAGGLGLSLLSSSPSSSSSLPDPPALWSNISLLLDSLHLSSSLSTSQCSSLRQVVERRELRIAEVYLKGREEGWGEKRWGEEMGRVLENKRSPSISVVHISPEFHPLTLEGSVGSWVSGLCRALRKKGHTVSVILPFYSSLSKDVVEDLRESAGQFSSIFDGKEVRNKVWMGTVYGVPVTFIEPIHPKNFFSREGLFGYEDDFERFAYFSRAALEYLLLLSRPFDVLHLHNWQTALVSPLFWDVIHNKGLQDCRLLFTCHNFKYQKSVNAELLRLVGLDPYSLNRQDRLQDPSNPSHVNITKGGIVYSNKVSTVSPLYASEVKTKEYGYGIDETLNTHSSKFVGLPSGINTSFASSSLTTVWDPQRDPFLPLCFSPEDLTGKEVAKAKLKKEMGLAIVDEETGEERALIACMVPEVTERILRNIRSAIDCAAKNRAQFAFIGTSKSPKVQIMLEDLQRESAASTHTALFLSSVKESESLAHLLMAASEISLCADFAEGDANTALLSLAYGSLPITRQLKGQSDSVFLDVDDPMRGRAQGNSFVFFSDKTSDMSATLERAIRKFYALRNSSDQASEWAKFQKNAMCCDSTWDGKASDAYIQAYFSILKC